VANPKNYLTQYALGKLLLRMGDFEGAYTHAKASIMSDRGEWMPYSLLACVYFCQRRFSKALTLIDELLKKYKEAKQLYYIRAYLEVNQLLMEVEYDEEM
jgi:Flp pilus assembly protein TadD